MLGTQWLLDAFGELSARAVLQRYTLQSNTFDIDSNLALAMLAVYHCSVTTLDSEYCDRTWDSCAASRRTLKSG